MAAVDELIWAILTLSGFGATIALTVAWAVTNFLRAKNGKELDRAKRSRSPVVLVNSLSHYASFKKVSKFMPGVLETVKFNKRAKKKRSIFFSPERVEIDIKPEDVKKGKDAELTKQCAQNMINLMATKVFLEDGVPVTVAVEDKIVTAGIPGLAAKSFYDKLEKVENLQEEINILKKHPDFKDLGNALEFILAKVSLIDFDVIRDYFDVTWNQVDSESYADQNYMQGVRDGAKKEQGTEKMIVYGGIAMGICGIVGGAILAFLG